MKEVGKKKENRKMVVIT